MDENQEGRLAEVVREHALKKIAGQDLSLHVEAFRGQPIEDREILRYLWEELEWPLRPWKLTGMALSREDGTRYECGV